MKNERTIVLGVCSDLHCGSTIGLCPPDGVELDDGGIYQPSEAQRWLWERWRAGWDHVAQIVKREKAEFNFLVNGDATDGNHHGTTQILSPAEGAHIKAAVESLRTPLAMKPKRIWIIRGTEAHVGKGGGLEEGMAVAMNREGAPIQKDPNTGTWSSWYRQLGFYGKMLDFTHHGRMGQRAHTRSSYNRLYAFDVWAERAMAGERAPDLAVRSHFHTYEDSGPPHPSKPITRVVQMPAFQLMTAFGWRKVAESLADIGLIAIIIRPNGEIEISPSVVKPSRGTVEVIA